MVIEVAANIMYDLTVEEAHNFTVGDGQWVVHNKCDLSKVASQLSAVFQRRPSTSGQCDQCANEVGRIIINAYPNYDVDIIMIQNVASMSGHRGAVLRAINPDGEIFNISTDPQNLQPFHEAVRIVANGDTYVIDSLVYEYQGVDPMTIHDYMNNLWADPYPLTAISGSRSVP